MKKFLSYILIGGMLCSLAACTNISGTVESTPETTTSTETVSDVKYKAGTYTGSAEGKNGTITLEVVLSETEIVSITVIEENETPDLGGKALSTMLPLIVESQSVDVDTMSGATITSKAIIEIVTKILADAAV